MSKIVMSGYYGFANAGDEAMLTAIIKLLRSKEKDVELTVISGNPHETSKKHHVNSIHRFAFLDIISAIKDCDLLLSGGGSLLQDVTSKRSLLYYLFIIFLGTFFNTKVMLFAQGIGPIHSVFMRKLTKYICSKADLITVRDKDSLYEIKRIGIPASKVELTADAVLTLPREGKGAGENILRRAGIPTDKMLIAIAIRNWKEDDAYLLELAKAADVLAGAQNAHIVLVPLQYPVDVDACERVADYMADKSVATVLNCNCNTEEYLSLMSNFDLLIGMRLHALIFAAVMGVPFVAVSYDPKIDGFVKDVEGVSAGKISSLEAKDIIFAAHKAMAAKPHDCLEKQRELSRSNATKAFSLLNK
ncbi:MAG: polysaccharide pyruvyl transferase CsaB [Phascolarctobacterium sp.]|nr:polysaccharide pyruvyl transferase CsaB [Phascolarctobacterium sp.]